MAPFLTPTPILRGFKERVECTTVHGGRIYLGTSTGNLYVYSLDETSGQEQEDIVEKTPVDVKKSLTRKSMDQLGYIKEINSLVVLSEMTVTLFPIPSFAPPTPLVKAKAAFSFAIQTSIHTVALPETESTNTDFAATRLKSKSIPILLTQLVVGCRRKVVIYSWKDGEAQDVKEAPLPHSARVISFLNSDTLSFAYSPTEHAIFSIPTLTATDIPHFASSAIPGVPAGTGLGMGALTGLTGYMTLGLGAKPKPLTISVGNDESIIVRDNEGLFIGVDAKLSKPNPIAWSASPEDIAFVQPYVVSVLPPGASPTQPSSPPVSSPATSTIQVHSCLSLAHTQTLTFPFSSSQAHLPPSSPPPGANTHTVPNNASIRLLTCSQPTKAPVFFVTTPLDRTTATAEGSSLWCMEMRSWAEQIDELVLAERYRDALGLLDTIDEALLPDKSKRQSLCRVLDAVSQFRESNFEEAITTFTELNINPAKVVALYPDSVSGRLGVPPENWIPLFGGPAPSHKEDSSSTRSRSSSIKVRDSPVAGGPDKEEGALPSKPSVERGSILGTGTLRGKLKTGLGAFMAQSPKDDDTASISSKQRVGASEDLRRSVEFLVPYLSNHRPKVAAALAVMGITPANQSHDVPMLSQVPVEELYALPDVPLSALTPQQLLRFAQIVDTALFKSYLVIRPGLIGSLCRVSNWCEVTEIEEELRARRKFGELIDLYHGKKMHPKALALLRELSAEQTDMEDRLGPSILYLQKLGPEHLEHIFAASRWVFDQDRDLAFNIFTSEDVELPRKAVADYLESFDVRVCVRYIEFLIDEREEESSDFHDRLAESYFKMTVLAKKQGDAKFEHEMYAKLLHFIDATKHYRIERLYDILSTTDLYEARAILLGRMGRHDQALELYVYQLHDYHKAEEYCKRTYKPGSETSNVFLTLLRIYLRPTVKLAEDVDLLQPALDLISRQSPRLDSVETMRLLPPLVTAQSVQTFLVEALRAPVFDAQVIRNISKARSDQLARRLMLLQSKRVKVTDSRICPQCHKRIGNSVIAVHVPRGEVTHYQCREAFSRKLSESRRYG